MYYIASIHAYDAMGSVIVGGEVREYTGAPGAEGVQVWTGSVRLDGVGEDHATRWLRDALVGLAETL